MVVTLSSVKIYAGGLPKQNSARKLSKYGVFSGPYFPAFRMNMNQKKLQIWILFTQGDLDAFDKGGDDQQLSTFETINSVTILKIKF